MGLDTDIYWLRGPIQYQKTLGKQTWKGISWKGILPNGWKGQEQLQKIHISITWQ